jgi:hypothetical protein
VGDAITLATSSQLAVLDRVARGVACRSALHVTRARPPLRKMVMRVVGRVGDLARRRICAPGVYRPHPPVIAA